MPTPFRTRANTNVEAVVDDNGIQVGIEYAHDAVHRDILVTASEHFPDVDILTPVKLLLVAPAAFDVHAIVEIIASGPCFVQTFFGPTLSGPPDVPGLHMRNNTASAKTTTEVFFHDQAGTIITADGTLKHEIRIPGNSGGAPSSRVGGTFRSGSELIVKNIKPVYIKITPESDNTKISVQTEYYEVAV